MRHLKTIVTKGLVETFDEAHPAENWLKYGNGDHTGHLNVSPEFPIEEADYPGIWVDFEPTQQLSIVGVNHKELVPVLDGDDLSGYRETTRWKFAGVVSYTIVAMSSNVRDRLFDELVKVLAFGKGDPIRGRYRAAIESNRFIGVTFDWDEIGQSGFSATPGTPWGTDDVIYEATARMECIGEFVSAPGDELLLPLNAVEIHPYNDQEPDPLPTGGWV